MAQQTQKIFFTLSQIGRGATGEKSDDGYVMPGISASFGSGIIEASVDCIISACRPKNKGTIEFQVKGCRFGGSDWPEVRYYYSPITTELMHESLQDEGMPFIINRSKYGGAT